MSYDDPRPCQRGKKCKHAYFDYSENTEYCDIDEDGTDCPYIKPWGKTKYKRDHNIEG